MKPTIALNFILLGLLLSGCAGPATKRVHRESLIQDPKIEIYRGAYTTHEYVFLHYSVAEPTAENEKKIADSYWARIPKEKFDDYRYRDVKWEVYRSENPPDLPSENLQPVEIINLAYETKPTDRTFLNKDQYLTYLIDMKGITPPVIFFNSMNDSVFHLVGQKMLHGSYRGHWNSPRGFYRDKGIAASNALNYPSAAAADAATAPLRAVLFNWE
tara:strand:+ start:1131 stop:1775 length:645 start_codon:yes stop_codon:yes gene_type:complete